MLFSTPLSEYRDLPQFLDEWLVTMEGVPEVFVGAMGDVSTSVNMREVLLRIRRARESPLSGPAQKPASFADSRFSSLWRLYFPGLLERWIARISDVLAIKKENEYLFSKGYAY